MSIGISYFHQNTRNLLTHTILIPYPPTSPPSSPLLPHQRPIHTIGTRSRTLVSRHGKLFDVILINYAWPKNWSAVLSGVLFSFREKKPMISGKVWNVQCVFDNKSVTASPCSQMSKCALHSDAVTSIETVNIVVNTSTQWCSSPRNVISHLSWNP